MSLVLVTGMSGVGKSAVLAELARRGHHVVDTDEPGWSSEVVGSDGVVDQRWHEDRIAELLSTAGDLFVGGCVSNQARFHERFDAIVLLSCPRDVMLERLAARTSNDFGKSDADRTRILSDLAAVEPLLRQVATTELDTSTLDVSAVADALEKVAARRTS